MQLHYQRIGDGEPLILLHGLFGSSDNWGAIAKHLSKTHNVISVDLRNHGKSPHHHAQSYVDMASDLVELCNELDLHNIHLLGHSLGGKVAMQFATTHPDRLDKLIVVDMAMRSYEDEHTHLIDAMLAVDLGRMQNRSEVDKALSLAIPNVMIRQFLLMNLIKSDTHLQWRINLPALKENYSLLTEAIETPTQFDKPSLFIRGERSDYIREDDIAQIKNTFTQSQFVSLPAGHWVHAEQQEPFIEAILNFINA